MNFTQNFAIPCLLFRAISSLDSGHNFQLNLLGSFSFGAITSFLLGLLGAQLLFKRNWDESVPVGFCCLFSNSVLLGLPITERAYGLDSLSGNFAIIAVHAPIAYFIGITVMELIRNQGTRDPKLIQKILGSILKMPLLLPWH